jgi:pimeloyl-ACP methyl ester carboxylesterase
MSRTHLRSAVLVPAVAAAVFALFVLPLAAEAQAKEPVRVEFLSEGAIVRGRFFPGAGGDPMTMVLVPGWPGNPDDVLGLGALLAPQGINVLMFNPRGLHGSEGTATFAGTLLDIGAAFRWLETPEVRTRFNIDPGKFALGGHSYGGGMAMAYAAQDPRIRRVISIAGNDHGEFIREFQRNPEMAEAIRKMLLGTRAPGGPARFDLEPTLRELIEHQDVYGLRENAAKLADRSILLLGGWEDAQVTVDQCLLPFYRALKRSGAADATFLVYHADHGFGNVRAKLASDIRDWLLRGRRE